MSSLSSVLVALALAVSAPAFACGACDEDIVAATYDHALAARAATQGKVLVYASIDGNGDVAALASKARAAARRSSGVDRDSVRVSVTPPALSFSLDPKKQSVDAAVADVEQHVSVDGFKLSVVRVVK